MMLGKKIYYVDLDDNEVKEGIINAEMIDTHGYRSYRIQTESGNTYRIKPYVYSDYESAITSLNVMKPIADEMKRIQKEAQDKIDALRLELNGEPEFEVENGEDSE